jgi:hypothetical protein
MTTPPADGRPTMRGLNILRADPSLAGTLDLGKWLRPPAAPASVFTAREGACLPALADWLPVATDALAAEPTGGG